MTSVATRECGLRIARMLHLFATCCLCTAGVMAPVPAGAQSGQTSALQGTVTDPSGSPLANVSLTVVSPSLIGGARQTTTGDTGAYLFSSLSPGTYEVSASRQGFKTTRLVDVILTPGLGVTVDLRLQLSSVSETINVRGAAPAIDVHSAAAPIVIDREFIDNLPLDRYVVGFTNLAPGVTQYTAFGGSMGANPFSLDGTNGNEPGWGTPAATPNANWLDSMQVVGLGASAEYGEFTGARVNGITRSGSNKFSGLAEYWMTRTNWTGNNRGELPPNLAQQFRPVQVLELWDTSNQVGGPITRDRLWFFAGMEYFKYARRPTAFANVPRTNNEPQTVTREPKAIVKLTAALTPSARLEGYLEYDNSKGTNNNAGPLVRPESLVSSEFPKHMGNVRLTWPLNERTLVEARYGEFRRHGVSGPTPPSSRSGPPSHFDTFTRVRSVNAGGFADNDERTWNGGFTLTHHAARLAGGSHVFKLGVDDERAKATYISGWPGNALYEDYNGAPNTLYLWDGATYRPSQNRMALFVQDHWQVNGRVTVEAGLRAARYQSSLPIEGVVFYRNSSVSPRLGVAWDVEDNHRTVVRAHYGRYHDPLVTTYYDFLDPLSQIPEIVMQVDESGQFQEITRFNSTTSTYSIDPRAKHSYSEEYFVGVERELRGRGSVRVQYVRRDFKDTLGFVDTGTIWTPIGVTDPGQDGTLGTSDDGGPMTIYYFGGSANLMVTNPDGAWRRYNGIQVIGTARDLGRLHVQASYTWASTRGNYNNEFTSNAASNDAGINGDFVNPNRALFSEGRTTTDATHDGQILGTYNLPYWGGVRASVVYRYTSGKPWARRAQFGPLTALGSVRVEPIGSRELPATNNLDVRIEKTFEARGALTVAMFVNVFNLTNQGIPLNVNGTSGPNFGLPLNWVDPRRLRAGVRMMF